MKFIGLILILTVFYKTAFGQSQILSNTLINGSAEAPQNSAIENGRYQIRKESNPEETIQNKKTVFKKKVNRKIASDEKNENKEQIDNKESSDEVKKEIPIEPSVAEQVKDLMLGNPQPVMETYKEQIHSDDVRLNRIEINILPGVIYNESKSNYSFRGYNTFSPFGKIGAEIWLTPMIGIYGQYSSSFGADISENSVNNSRVPVTNEFLEVGAEYRKFFGMSRRSNSALFGLHYEEFKFTVPSDSLKRIRSKSNGLGVHFSARFPVAPSYSWIVGGKINPRMSHVETSTGINVQSGSSVESSKFGLNFGGEFKLSRHHQLIWDLSWSIEKNQFSGSSNTMDPETSVAPSGVSVSNSITIFTFGYRWGQ